MNSTGIAHSHSGAKPEICKGGEAVLVVWGRSPQPPEANGGLWAKPLTSGGSSASARDWGSRGKAPSRWRHRGLGAEPPTLENFAFFAKIT